jgi:hypothetical protein
LSSFFLVGVNTQKLSPNKKNICQERIALRHHPDF